MTKEEIRKTVKGWMDEAIRAVESAERYPNLAGPTGAIQYAALASAYSRVLELLDEEVPDDGSSD